MCASSCVPAQDVAGNMWEGLGLEIKTLSAAVSAPLRWKEQHGGGRAAGGAMLFTETFPHCLSFPVCSPAGGISCVPYPFPHPCQPCSCVASSSSTQHQGFSAAPHCLLSSLRQPFAIANPVCLSPARGLTKRCRCCCPTVSPARAETSFPIPAASIKIFQRCLRDQTSCRWVTDCHGSAGLSPSRGDSLLVPIMEGNSSKVASSCGDGLGMWLEIRLEFGEHELLLHITVCLDLTPGPTMTSFCHHHYPAPTTTFLAGKSNWRARRRHAAFLSPQHGCV